MLTPPQARTVALITFLSVIITLGALTFATAAPARTCTEDAACWNWATMGNHTRGVTTVHETHIVVSPCHFQRLARSGKLTYWPMRGDATALRVQCHSNIREPNH